MKRHAFALLLALAVGAFLAPLAASAPPPAKAHRLAIFSGTASAAAIHALPNYKALFEELAALGYVEGRGLVIDIRSAGGDFGRLPALAAEVVASKPDVVLVGTCGAPLDALRRATTSIPIVVAACTNDMVLDGIVTSLARPGGNLTGLQKLTPELSAKRLELLKLVIPDATRVAVLWDPGYSDFTADWRALRAAAQTLRVSLLPVEARGPAEFEAAVAAMAAQRAQAFVTFSDAVTYVHAQRLADAAAKYRLPAIYAYEEITQAGGLISYGPSIPAMFRRSATFVDKILKGAKPADLPVEQPTRFPLVVNLKTARTLGVTIPQTILIRADQVIE